MKINSAHGAGGKLMGELISGIFEKHFGNEILGEMEDAARLSLPSRSIAFTTDSFVVTPLFFPGGDIGKLAVCGTVNDLLMRGARPKYLSAGFILEEGLEIETLERVVISMAAAAKEAGVEIVAGDTKVVEGKGGLYINTSGIGVIEKDAGISSRGARKNDAVIVSGNLGDHHACILSARMNVQNTIKSDCAPLVEMVLALVGGGVKIGAMRDITRGGLATVLNEIAIASGVAIELFAGVDLAGEQVQGFCDILGLDPLYMANEGKLMLTVPKEDAKKAVEIMRGCKYGQEARIIGEVRGGEAMVTMRTCSGGIRRIGPLIGESLPRIC